MWLIDFLLCCVEVPFLFSSFYNFGAYSIVKGYAMVRAIHIVWLVSRARKNGVVQVQYNGNVYLFIFLVGVQLNCVRLCFLEIHF